MTDLRKTIEPKTDQLNADTLIGGPITVKVAAVKLLGGDQPIAIHYEGDNGKPYKPCKLMRRVMVQIWGHDGNAYVGQRMTLFRDKKVQFGGVEVGGIRISHMSGIAEPTTMALSVSKTNRKPFTVKPLGDETMDEKAARFRSLGNEIARLMKDAETPELVAKIWKDRTANIEAVRSFSAKAFEGLEKIYKDRGPKDIAPSTDEGDLPADEEELAI